MTLSFRKTFNGEVVAEWQLEIAAGKRVLSRGCSPRRGVKSDCDSSASLEDDIFISNIEAFNGTAEGQRAIKPL